MLQNHLLQRLDKQQRKEREKVNMLTQMYGVIIVAIIVVWGAVIIKYNSENKKYKASSYGKQHNNNFINILGNKGARGEYRTSQFLEEAPFKKKMLFNVYIPNRSGAMTELDIIMITTKGIYVVENKNYSGWIFGDENSKNWCETIKGKKFFFYNPVKQNKSHIKNLEKVLQIGDEKYISLIIFNANANLKKISTESKNLYVIASQQIKKFFQEQNTLPDQLTSEEIETLYQKLLPGTQLSDEEKKQHVERIQKQYKKK